MMVDVESLVRHLAAESSPFGLLSRQSLSTADTLRRKFPERLRCLFSPEHGWFGLAGPGEKTASSVHPAWNIPVHSLYGTSRRPSPEMLEGLGRLVIDLQDIGVRCYTYLATIKLVIEAAADAHLPVTLLDRPIPLGGIVDGPRLDQAFSSFVAPIDVPICHGMTPGECALHIVKTEGLDLDLTIIQIKGWTHSSREPWINFIPPSPAIRSWDCAAMYPATVFTEAFPSVDCDRNGSLAFRIVGAPWMDATRLREAVEDDLLNLGIAVRQLRYKPAGGTCADENLDGLFMYISNPERFRPFSAGTVLLSALYALWPEELLDKWRPEWLDKISGSTVLRNALTAGSAASMPRVWAADCGDFAAVRTTLYA